MNLIYHLKTKLFLVLILFLLFDLSFSFIQYYNCPIGGDIAEVAIPKKNTGYYDALNDPIGYKALTQKTEYPNPNRFFAHYVTSSYFLHVPIFLQNFVGPIDSVYLSVALSKIATHILFLILFFLYILNARFRFSKEFFLIACLTTPFFQTYGFNRYMGIIDQSAVYNFFYALPIALLLIALLPVYRFFVFEQSKILLPIWKKVILILFIPFITLNGPLIPGITLVLFLIFALYTIKLMWKLRHTKSSLQQKLNPYNLPAFLLFFLVLIVLCSLYSLYIGQFNSLNRIDQISIYERYLRLPLGLFYILTQKIGYLLLLLAVAINFFLLHKFQSGLNAKKAFTILKWIGLFSLIYILLLPLGGYRSYRGNIIRYDTILPITILLVFAFVYSAFVLLKLSNFRYKTIFSLFLALLVFIYSFADKLNSDANQCERKLMTQLSKSNNTKAKLPSDCALMEWNIMQDYKNSELNARLLKHWGVTDSLVLYRQE